MNTDQRAALSLNLDALETGFDLVATPGDELMDAFYARLFIAVPAVTPLFAGTDVRRQKAMLLGTPRASNPRAQRAAGPRADVAAHVGRDAALGRGLAPHMRDHPHPSSPSSTLQQQQDMNTRGTRRHRRTLR